MRLELHRLSLGSGPTGEQRQCNILSVSLRQSPVPPPAQPSSDVIVLNQSLTHLASPVTVILYYTQVFGDILFEDIDGYI